MSEIKVRLVTTPNSDLKTVNSARVSMAKHHNSFEDDVKGNKGLINYLASHHHWTPFSHNRDTIFFPIDNKIDYYHFLEFITLQLSLEDKASMVMQTVTLNDMKFLAIKTSLYGWVNIVKKIDNSFISSDDSTIHRILSVLSHKYQYSFSALFKPELTSKYLIEEQLAINNLNILNLCIPQLGTHMFDITFYETIPIFVARQRFKHMIGFTYNEVSRRYVDDDPTFYTPDVWRQRPDKSIKQGSGSDCVDQKTLKDNYNKLENDNLSYYKELVDKSKFNVAPEMARITLMQSMMTEYYVTGNMDAWERLINQRIDSTAQKEITDLAKLLNDELVEIKNSIRNIISYHMHGQNINLVHELEKIGVF